MVTKQLLLRLSLCCFLVSAASARPGVLASEPLLTSARVDPNIMFSLDSSGSMSNIVVDTPFDPATIYFSCPGSQDLTLGSSVEQYVTWGSGRPYIRYSGTNYDWGTTPGNGSTGRPKRCFQNDQMYNARLYGNANNGQAKFPSGYANTRYSGNYLNWYFGSAPTSWGNSARNKPDTVRRVDVQRDVAVQTLNGLNDVRVGLTRFDGNSGAHILVGINDIANNRNIMINAINAITPGGNTPLAETLHGIGRYFVQGHNNNLTLHPAQANETQKRAYTVFNDVPRYSSGVNRSSPIQYFCQKSFIAMITDGRPSQDRNIDPNTRLTDYDSDCLNANPACLTFDRKPNQVYESSGSDYLDDVAMALFDIDLRPDLVDTDGNAVKNNISTYTIGFSDPIVQGDPLLREAAAQSGGQYFEAKDSQGLVTALQDVVASISQQTNTAAGATFNAGNLSVNSATYLTRYNTARWSGDVLKFNVNDQGNISGPVWQAAPVLDAQSLNDLFIFTYNRDTTSAVPFRQLNQLSAAQQADLNTSPNGAPDLLGQSRVDFLIGNRSLEGTVFRTRDSILADTVHGAPVFSGEPESNWSDISPFPSTIGNKYSDFKFSRANRTPVVYSADNGGFLRGFNANNGTNVLSFVPSNLFTNRPNAGMHYLTDKAYQHRFYNDLAPVVQDAYVATTAGGSASWHTILVGGERAGGRGYYALDITNPGNFSDPNADNIFLWEFTNLDNQDLGFAYSEPVIGLMNNGRWAAVFGNGYNNTGSGRAKLFIVFLDGGLDGTWTQGQDYIVINTKKGNLGKKNGLSTPAAIDLDGNGTMDRVYAGDLFGNMWAFDLSSSNSANWDVAYGGGQPKPLFRAGLNQPITGKPIIVRHPTVGNTVNNKPNTLVLFGSGQFLTSDDKLTTKTQAFYGVWDTDLHNGNLQRNTLQRQAYVVKTSSIRVVTDRTVDYTASGNNREFGWYITLPTSGERMITTPIIRENIVFFSTFFPDISTPCAFGGSGFLMGLKVENGGEPDHVVFDVNNDSQLDDTDNVNNRIVSGIRFDHGVPMQPSLRGEYLFTPGSDGILGKVKVFLNDKLLGRVSWQELRND